MFAHAVKYEARLEDGSVVSKSEGIEFAVKDGYFCPALSKAVKTMKKGEKVLLTVKPQCEPFFRKSAIQNYDCCAPKVS